MEDWRKKVDDAVWGRLIESGLGVDEGLLAPPGALRAFRPPEVNGPEARAASIASAQSVFDVIERDGTNADVLRFGTLWLCDLSLATHRAARGRPLRIATVRKRLNRDASRAEESLLVHGLALARRERPGRPNLRAPLSVLSALAWYLEYSTNRPRLGELAKLLRAVHPPILLAMAADPSADPDKREDWRRLGEAIRAYRSGADGEADYASLAAAMKNLGVLPP
jgi:hypothetical protein